jgi:hypothetical protein
MLAEFFSVVALLFVPAEHLGRVDQGMHGGCHRNGESHGKLWDDVIRKFYHQVVVSRSHEHASG